MRRITSVIAIAVTALIGGAGIAGAGVPDYTVERGDTLSELQPRDWQYTCIINVAEGRIPHCDLIITGQQIRTRISVKERQDIDRWFGALTSAPTSAPARAVQPQAEPRSEPAFCAGLGGVTEPLASKTCNAIRASGGACHVVSGFRSRAEQAELYERYLNGTGNLAAPPDSSNHETGDAVDMSDGCAAELRGQGLVTPVPGESWHWELP